MRRTLTPELMDDPGVPREDLRRSLRYIRQVNALLGGSGALLAHLARWSARWPTSAPITLLDIATGSADIPIRARRWALDRGFDLRITAIDRHHATLDEAREQLARATRADPRIGAGITIEQADALKLTERFEPRSFDYCHAALFLHHLPDVEVLTVLRIMDQLCAAGLVWSDLVRSRIRRALVELIIVGRSHIIRHDARVSVEAGFTKQEAQDAARRVGITYAAWRCPLGWYRFTLAGEKPGAWSTAIPRRAATPEESRRA